MSEAGVREALWTLRKVAGEKQQGLDLLDATSKDRPLEGLEIVLMNRSEWEKHIR